MPYAPKLYRFAKSLGGEKPGHKYFKRVMTGNAGNPWQYYYSKEEFDAAHGKGEVPGLHAADLKPGATVTVNRTVWEVHSVVPHPGGKTFVLKGPKGTSATLETHGDGSHSMRTFTAKGGSSGTKTIKTLAVGGEKAPEFKLPEKFETKADYDGPEYAPDVYEKFMKTKEMKALAKEGKGAWKIALQIPDREKREGVKSMLMEHYWIQRRRLVAKLLSASKN